MKPQRTIGIFHYQVGLTDGVSLEIDKWKTVLEELGQRVILCAGDLGAAEGVLIPELYHHRPEIEILDRNVFKELNDFTNSEMKQFLKDLIQTLETRLSSVIQENKIDLIITNNIWSVALNLPAAIALENVRRKLKLPAIAHHHDFYWERKGKIALTCPVAIDTMDRYFPPRSSLIKHVVINSIAQNELKERKGIKSTIIPNVFDFDPPGWLIDEYNQDLRERINLRENDICILQATRIVPRKGIELAIDLVKALNAPRRREKLQSQDLYNGQKFGKDSSIVLVVVGNDRDDATGVYLENLKRKAIREEVDLRYVNEFFAPARACIADSKIYSLWDSYVIADLVTYPSLWEGWGNQLLEALKAKLPVALFEYPVFLKDIKKKGMQYISLGSEVSRWDQNNLAHIPEKVIENAADQCVVFLTNKEYREEIVNKNYQVCQENFSLNHLRHKLAEFSLI